MYGVGGAYPQAEGNVMAVYHVIYTEKTGGIISKIMEFESSPDAEKWLESIGATYWEIGVNIQGWRSVIEVQGQKNRRKN